MTGHNPDTTAPPDGIDADALRAQWDGHVRRHGQVVVASLLALGVGYSAAEEIAQATWARLFEQHSRGRLEELVLPGLAVRQARFLAMDHLRRARVQQSGRLSLDGGDLALADPSASPEARALSRQEVARALTALEGCSPKARKIFSLVYVDGASSAAEVASEVGLSVQRVRQTLCEVRRALRQALADQEAGA